MKSNATLYIVVIGVIVVLGLGFVLIRMPKTASGEELVPFATCLKDKGAQFYGAFWCPHCQKQKALFGAAAKALPYVECSTADGQGRLQVCIDKNIEGYPTWIFADGSREVREMTLADLSAKTSCPLPSGTASTSSVTIEGTSTSASSVN